MKKITKYNNLDEYMEDYYPMVNKTVGDWNETVAEETSKDILKLHSTDFLSTVLTEGFYALHYLRWRQVYNSSQLMIINGDEMFQDPGGVMEKIQQFVGIPKLLLKDDYVSDPDNPGFFCYKDWRTDELSCLPKAKQRTRNKLEMSQDTLIKLKAMYGSHNEALFKILGKRFSWS